jgi:hypothetical protein
MWRYFVGACAALLLAVAGMFLFRGSASTEAKVPRQPAAVQAEERAALPEEAPSATAKTREQKRFDRIDKDRDEAISRAEFFALRQKAFARLDTNRDGKLGFEEWATKSVVKFAGADKDKSGVLTRAEFATTAPTPRAAKPKCVCAPAKAAPSHPPAAQEAEGEPDE